MSIKKYKIAQLVPHEKPMLLLDDMVAYGDDWLSAELEITPESEFINENNAVPSLVGIEYMAQTVAAFAGKESRENGEPVKIGFLVGTRKYMSTVSEFSIGTKLLITAERVMQGDNGLSVFQCKIEDAASGEEIANAMLNVFQPENANEFLQGNQ